METGDIEIEQNPSNEESIDIEEEYEIEDKIIGTWRMKHHIYEKLSN